jgi:hypothetical protein
LELEVPDFMNSTLEAYQGQNLLLIIKDNNENLWITGHEAPYSIDKSDGETGGDRNVLQLTVVQNSYLKVEPLVLASVTLPTE